jgi:hypothetical protein
VYVTTNFVLSEVIAHLYATLTPQQAEAFVNALLVLCHNVDFGLPAPLEPHFNQATRSFRMNKILDGSSWNTSERSEQRKNSIAF